MGPASDEEAHKQRKEGANPKKKQPTKNTSVHCVEPGSKKAWRSSTNMGKTFLWICRESRRDGGGRNKPS